MSTDRRTYIRLHDGMPEHPKVVGLTDPAFRAYVELLCWSSRHLTDGAVPAGAARRTARPKVLTELAAAGLLDAAVDGFVLHDYLLHQRSKEQVEAAIDQRRAAGAAGGKAKAQRRDTRPASETGSESLSEPLALPLGEPAAEPSSETASNGLPETETETENRETTPPPPSVVAPKRRASQVPDDFTVTDGMRNWAAAEVPRVDVDAQTAQFVDHFRASGKPHKDWVAAWRNWMRRAAEFGHVRALPGGAIADRMAVGYGDADRSAPARTLTPDEWAREHRAGPRTASGGSR